MIENWLSSGNGVLLLVLTLVFAGTFATDVWRIAGAYLSSGLKAESPVLQWVKDVSTALIAGFVTRMLFFPPEMLAQAPLTLRIGAIFAGLTGFYLSGRSLILGLVFGMLVMIAGQWILNV